MTEPQPVGPEAYDDEWLESAWGTRANAALLSREIDYPRPRVARALELARIEPGVRLLDIACGRGEVPALAAEKGAFAVGIDFSARSLAYAQKVSASRQGHISAGTMLLAKADACRLPFADGSFDRITMLDIIEHLLPGQLSTMMCEVRRLLAPGGYAVLHTLPNRWVYDITFPMLHLASSRFPRNPRGPIDSKIHVNEQSLPQLSSMLMACGLEHRLWLEQMMPAQARWNQLQDTYGDNRDTIYPMLTGIWGRGLELASMTPLKLILANDIFGFAWSGDKPSSLRLPSAWIERLALATLAGNGQQEQRWNPGQQ